MKTNNWSELLENAKRRLSVLTLQMERAGIGQKGDFQNQIDNEEENIRFYEAKLSAIKQATPANEINIFFFVIVSVKEKVRENIGSNLYSLLEEKRYNEDDCSKWTPFTNSPDISQILNEFKQKYPFDPVYICDGIDDDLYDDFYIKINDHIEKSVAIIDLLSINESNKQIALKFDTTKAGLIMPLCRSLLCHSQIVDFTRAIASEFKALQAYTNKGVPCTLYFSDVSGLDSFKRHLTTILFTQFPISNQSTFQSNVRELQIGFK